ncbi:MAG: TonB-dependent receptor [Cellvibrionaceae bacterium]|nr:TonB-dependent receptor [Cellvibrionaceae bacterium]
MLANRFIRKKLLLAMLAASATAMANAQQAGNWPDSQLIETEEVAELEEVVVTARKREELLSQVPVAVSVFSSSQLQKRGIFAIPNLQDVVPGLDIVDSFSAKTDRTVQNLVIRGFSPSNGLESTVSMFIDGVPVTSGTALTSVGSPERIEVLRGPQSAYFGRNTFAGAINVVTRNPAEQFTGSLMMEVAEFNFSRLRGEIDAPLMDGLLGLRMTLEGYQRNGHYTNVPDGKSLGDQESILGSLTLAFTPLENLSVKAYAYVSEDNDGPAASAFLPAVDLFDSNNNQLLASQSNCLVNGNPFFCGTLPSLENPVSYNTELTPQIAEILNNPTNQITPGLVDGYGSGREYSHFHLVADWGISEALNLTFLAGVNDESWALLNDIDHYYSEIFNYAFYAQNQVKDSSSELRLSYNDEGPISGVIGISYLDRKTATGVANLLSPAEDQVSVDEPSDRSAETVGVFFGVTYAINQMFSVTFEGRQQEDTLTLASLPSQSADEISEIFSNFIPRIIGEMSLNDGLNAYLSYSEGVNPGAFNRTLLGLAEEDLETAAGLGIDFRVEPEEVKNYEIGLKGMLFEGRFSYATALFQADWSNQINNTAFSLAGQDSVVSASVNSGEVITRGLEFESSVLLMDSLTINTAFAYMDSDIQSFQNNNLSEFIGDTDYSGKEQPFFSPLSLSVGLEFDSVLFNSPYFARADYTFREGQWLSQANLAKTPDINRVNLRAGIELLSFLDLQIYVNNLLDDDGYLAGHHLNVFEQTFAFAQTPSAALATLPLKRTAGAQLTFSF